MSCGAVIQAVVGDGRCSRPSQTQHVPTSVPTKPQPMAAHPRRCREAWRQTWVWAAHVQRAGGRCVTVASQTGPGRGTLSPDSRLVLAAQAARAFGYGFGAVLLGITLESRRLSPAEVGGVLAAVVAGAVFSSLAVARFGDRWGRRLGERLGLLPTMVFTHLPSNLLLAGLGFAPNLGVAVTLLLARVALSQMDVPTRQAYVMALVDPAERTAAAAYTNTARYLARPAGPALAGAAASASLGAPFVIAGTIKAAYDLVLWSW